jgi:hypothetical protein
MNWVYEHSVEIAVGCGCFAGLVMALLAYCCCVMSGRYER